ncbi:hypothetical protein BD413DRAFT_69898 [Trametes elegans]|nr:hypothetical protein BD413DRAFT_69898 [Trametes elegans]
MARVYSVFEPAQFQTRPAHVASRADGGGDCCSPLCPGAGRGAAGSAQATGCAPETGAGAMIMVDAAGCILWALLTHPCSSQSPGSPSRDTVPMLHERSMIRFSLTTDQHNRLSTCLPTVHTSMWAKFRRRTQRLFLRMFVCCRSWPFTGQRSSTQGPTLLGAGDRPRRHDVPVSQRTAAA